MAVKVIAEDPRGISDGRGRPTTEPYSLTFSALRVAFEVPPMAPIAQSQY